MTSKLQSRAHNWSFRIGTAKEVAPQLRDKESEVLAWLSLKWRSDVLRY